MRREYLFVDLGYLGMKPRTKFGIFIIPRMNKWGLNPLPHTFFFIFVSQNCSNIYLDGLYDSVIGIDMLHH